ncbi:uncharacterized protein LOC118274913 isoform X1 [Spodoptera frugiperda]|uniref:Uncharacterized protein LOC118274913 isoform X1 n=1 Tax=Spodoptera frugiperda TaxID=7108 RepID=A0A9R0DTT7_SPOFR|nr:uncharacterized protein LOC118274913 isoform X1 [Spodoptera frugiperda]
MIRTVTSMLALIMSVTGHVAEASDFVSPCPSVFKYEPQGNEVGKWYGVANFTSEFTLYGLWMNIVLDSKADILGNWIGEVTTDDNIDFKIENTKTKLSAQEPLSVRFFVQYKSQNVTPKLKAIRVNGREICNIEIPQVTEGPKPITEQVVYDVWSRDTDKTTVRPTVTSTTTSYKQQTTSTQQYWYQQIDKQRTTTKSYWTQTTTPNVYPVKLVDRQTTTVKPQFWTEAKTTESTTQTTSKPQYWQQTTLKPIYWAKGEDKLQTTVKPQVWPYDKAENTQQKSEDKINVTTEKNKVQTWSHSRVTSNQHTKTHDHRNKTKGHSHGHSQNSNNWPKNNEVQIVENIQTNTSVYIQTANDSTYYTTDKTVVWPVVKVTENQTLLPVNKIENSSHALDKQKVHIKHWPKIPADNSTIVVPKQTGVDSSSFIWVESQPTYSGAGHYIRTETPAQNSPIYVRPEDKERVSDKRYETAQYSHDTTRYEPEKAQRVSPVNTYQKKDQQYDNEEDHLVVKPIKRTDENVQKQNWSGERTVDYYGDSPQSFVGHHTKNKMRLEAEDDGYIKYSDDIMKVSGESTNSHFNSYQLTTDAPAALFYKSEDYDIPRKEDKIEYYVGGLPVFYIPNHAPRPKMELICGNVLLNKDKKSNKSLTATLEGQWPWQIALYQQQTSVDFRYICGGTLVSKRHVITAAHCVTKKFSTRVVNQNTLTVYLGKHNLRNSVEGVQVKFVSRIFVHPEYNSTVFSSDLAILELRDEVTYSERVQPACLWPENEKELKYVVGERGSVVGWGYESTGKAREELTLLEMPVVDQQTCLSSYEKFFGIFTSDKTYCAGYRDVGSACNGDSGGGMVFQRDGSWYLRGVVSLSVALKGIYRCDPTHYVIFTDVAKFLPWIEEHVEDYSI